VAPAEPQRAGRPPDPGTRTPTSFEHRGALKALRQVLAPHYALGAEVARGGMAIVYEATDIRHDRRVAIKVLNPALIGGVAAERFLGEVRTIARLRHPHIVPLIDSGSAGELLYYVMPYLDEGSLADRIRRERRLGIDEAIRIAREVGDALAHAHAQGIVHRDIKPSNVMMAAGHAMVSDFGLARPIERVTTQRLTPTDANVGTPLYMSPEQILRSPELDPRSDQYSLACVVFEMLAGRPPHVGGQELIAFQHCSVEPPPLSTFRPEAPFTITSALQRALAKLPADRFADVEEFARALTREAAAPTHATAVGETPPHHLPRVATSFVGRENELWACGRLLDGERLVTLAGLGGSGKTRLAIRLAERGLPAYAGGAWFVELAPVVDDDRVIEAIAAAIGVRERPDRTLEDVIREHIGARRTLLVLDNCEQVREGAAAAARALLEACPQAIVLATSREPLGVPGERVFRVPPLGVPPADAALDTHAIANFEAVRLFVARAASVSDGFRLSDANAPAVADICRTLEGIPLAIELAAARTRMVSVEEIRRMLSDRFRLLGGAGAASVDRHRTLRTAIDWSYELLEPQERALLRALAVFRGGWTLAAAAAVAAGGDSFIALDEMTRLAEKSLLLIDRLDGQESRYRMLETVRLYALERLESEGDAAAMRSAHLAWFHGLAATGDRAIWTGTDQALWLDRLSNDHENLLAALAWAAGDATRAEQGLELAAKLYRFWYTRGHYETARTALERALAAPGAAAARGDHAQALFVAGGIAVFQGRFEEARARYTECLAVWREMGESRGVARALVGLALVDAAAGRYEEARAANRESLSIYRQIGDTHSVQIVLHNLGDVALCEGSWPEAHGFFQESLAIARDDRTLTALTLGRVGLVAVRQGHPDRALAPLAEALRIAGELKAMDSGLEALEAVAELAARSGRDEDAGRLFGCADALRERAGVSKEPGHRETQAGVIERLRATMPAETFETAWARDRALTLEAACEAAGRWLERSGPEWADTEG
jgi:predicted ATPase/tRNA A-37 threonylcarbamoyl transferase component Bud32